VDAASSQQQVLFPELRAAPVAPSPLLRELLAFRAFGATSQYAVTRVGDVCVDTVINEFWTSAQRTGHALHEVSYRACFKPQLPAFFIERLSQAGDVVYDPFMGRGTTPLEAALRSRVPAGNDVNPLSAMLLRPRLSPPEPGVVAARLAGIGLEFAGDLDADLLAFYHPDTLRELCGLRAWLLQRDRDGGLDDVDDWIRMVAINRLTGHSPGFFSVYTLPPNQATSASAQRKINDKRAQTPPRRDVRAIIQKKSAQLLANVDAATRDALAASAAKATLLCAPADATPQLGSGSVQLVVTSPPFLDVVQYAQDNWLRCWFAGIDAAAVPMTMAKTLPAWRAAMTSVFTELRRVLAPGGHVAFEVGEIRSGTVRLEEEVIPAATAAGLVPVLVLINEQEFTKTANCWGIANNKRGTNSNRVVLLRRE
jgi:hypothetical protein